MFVCSRGLRPRSLPLKVDARFTADVDITSKRDTPASQRPATERRPAFARLPLSWHLHHPSGGDRLRLGLADYESVTCQHP